MWWRLLVLTGLFFAVSRAWIEDYRQLTGWAGAVYYNSANGHYYQWVHHGGISWRDAFRQAAQSRFAGAAGHLATLNSQQENDFVNRHFHGGDSYWIAASDHDQEGTWKWVAGEEAGETFYVVGETCCDEIFSAWAEGEPNNQKDEDYAAARWMGSPNWNDLSGSNGAARGYLIEYPALPHPEKLIITTGNTRSPVFGSQRPTIVGEKDGVTWNW